MHRCARELIAVASPTFQSLRMRTQTYNAHAGRNKASTKEAAASGQGETAGGGKKQ